MDSDAARTAFAALGQTARLEVFRLLLRAGPRGMLAGEIATALAMRQNTMSVNLSVLTVAGLLRPSREGRGVRYVADLDGLRRLLGFLMQDCCNGAPETCAPVIQALVQPLAKRSAMPDRPWNVLFLCTGNSARSILAEALLNKTGNGRFRAWSAGSHPAGAVNPHAIDLLGRLGYDTAGLRSKSWDEFAGPDAPTMDFVFTVCDQAAAEPCPVWPGQPMSAHWGLPDPARVEGSPAEVALAFADTLRMLDTRIGVFCALPVASLDRLSLQRRLDDIGRSS